ncbi:helix-turn-helix domain-containing protein [Pseudoclavibacter sp. AY1F1]|uniref:helix-turn-helix domain-containing protein n=1 Tax=Pseudoclavibacter sp. AY1F1 TaxID=2080583 RepID=UPI0011B04710|nr:helix-turn-helix domain-containing protein [Pseudoclavibacter sp. AY1F1]
MSAGSAVVVSPGRELVEFTAAARRQTLLLFSVDFRALGVPFLSADRKIHLLNEATMTSMAYGAWHALANSANPSSLHAETITQAQAISVARALLAQWKGPEESGGDLYARAKHYIRVHASDPDLDPTRVADALGTAPRTLQVAFKKHGTTINRELRRKRYENVQLLLQGRPTAPRLEIARQAGFRSLKQLRDAGRDFSTEVLPNSTTKRNSD